MDYEKLYKKVLDNASVMHKTGNKDVKQIMEQLFPELKESEDEKIRKEILFIVKEKKEETGDRLGVLGMSYDDMITWLEKQGEQKITDKVEPKFKVGDTIRLKNSLAEFTIEHISDGRYYFKGCSIDIIACDRDYYKLAVPKLSNLENNGEKWSEEDKKKLNRIYRLIAEAADEHAFWTTCRLIGDKECVELQDFLKSLKPQPKQEWSEEDEFCMNTILNILEQLKGQSPYEEDDTAEKCINFLKSKLKK